MKRKKTGNHRGMQWLTLCISTAMVLVLLGLVVFSVLTSRNLSIWVKENLTVTVMLSDDASINDAKRLCRNLYYRPYSKNIDYVSKEQALQEQTKEMGADPSEFLGANPFVATLELQLHSDYANRDSLIWIKQELLNTPKVTDVAYQEDLMDNVNTTLGRINIVLLVLALLLTFVSYQLISNTVRLSVYSRRFIIHTMKLVGASWGFIRRPFLRQAMLIGLVAALLACLVLGICFYSLYYYEPKVLSIIGWQELTVTAVAVFLFGLVITLICSWISVNRFLKMKAAEIYKI